MEKIVEVMLIFFIGAMSGWIIELFFRRFVSQKRWVNPGFLNGPYLPLYGFGLVGLYLVCRIDLSWTNLSEVWQVVIKMIIIPILMTIIEYIAGLIFIKGMKIKLWDYSNRWGNIQGIICPLFSAFWGIIGMAYYLFVDPEIVGVIVWLSKNLAFSFVIGTVFGIFIIDLCKSLDIANKIRKVAVKEKVVITYEKFKYSVTERERKLKNKVSFIHPFNSSDNLTDVVKEYIENSKSKMGELMFISEEKADILAIIGFVTSLFGLNFVSLVICIGAKKSRKNKIFWLIGIILSSIEILSIIVILFLYAFKVI